MDKELNYDVAHLGHVEILTPKPEESLRFFKDLLGMKEVAGRAIQSTCAAGTITSVIL